MFVYISNAVDIDELIVRMVPTLLITYIKTVHLQMHVRRRCSTSLQGAC